MRGQAGQRGLCKPEVVYGQIRYATMWPLCAQLGVACCSQPAISGTAQAMCSWLVLVDGTTMPAAAAWDSLKSPRTHTSLQREDNGG